tara:strand:+ start:74 stop:328 length:255 start_codon:yes stop_codon:yes gene_type:complete
MTNQEKKQFYTYYIERLIFNGYNVEELLFNPPKLKYLNFKGIYNHIVEMEMHSNDFENIKEFENHFSYISELYNKAKQFNLITN